MVAAVAESKSVRLDIPGVGVRTPGCESPSRSFGGAEFGDLSPQGSDLDLRGTAADPPRPRRRRARANADFSLLDNVHPGCMDYCQQGGGPVLLGRTALRGALAETCKLGLAERESKTVADYLVGKDWQETHPDITESSAEDSQASVVGACIDGGSDLECVIVAAM